MNEKVPIIFTKYFDRIICPHCGFDCVVIAVFRTSNEVLEENDDYDKWITMLLQKCDYCPDCGKEIK